jgi:ribosomal protein S18 acetylase RimI-like enzyme
MVEHISRTAYMLRLPRHTSRGVPPQRRRFGGIVGQGLDPSTASAAFSAPGAVTWVAMRGGEVIGLAHLLNNGIVHAHLSLVGVLPSYRREGVARKLVSEAFRAGGGKWLDLCAEPGSEQFHRSFPHQERSGFRIYP